EEHVGLLLGEPRAHRREALEDRLPRRVVGLLRVDRECDRRRVRDRDSADDLRQDWSPPKKESDYRVFGLRWRFSWAARIPPSASILGSSNSTTWAMPRTKPRRLTAESAQDKGVLDADIVK